MPTMTLSCSSQPKQAVATNALHSPQPATAAPSAVSPLPDRLAYAPAPAGQWSSAATVALIASGALVCLCCGLLAGVVVAGGRVHDIARMLTDPVSRASGGITRTRVFTERLTAVKQEPPRTITQTRTLRIARPARTVVNTITVTAPPTTSTGSPPSNTSPPDTTSGTSTNGGQR